LNFIKNLYLCAMLTNRFHNPLIFLLILFIALSCSQYDKVIKSEDVNVKFTKTFEYYNKGDYVKAGTLFDQLAPLTRGTRRADSVYFYQAMTQYKLNDFIIAGHYFNQFTKYYENSHFIEEAAYMEAYCYYMQSPRPELDQTSTYQAMDAFRLYMLKYPTSPRVTDCQRILKELYEKLTEKSFLSARLYYYLNDYKASIVALSGCLVEYPDSKYREDIMFLLLKSKYLLAVKSVQSKQTERFQDAVDEYYSFITEFPESKSKKQADNMYEIASERIKDKNTDKELTDN
jgi:outer membrane protein assembly factor BamD